CTAAPPTVLLLHLHHAGVTALPDRPGAHGSGDHHGTAAPDFGAPGGDASDSHGAAHREADIQHRVPRPVALAVAAGVGAVCHARRIDAWRRDPGLRIARHRRITTGCARAVLFLRATRQFERHGVDIYYRRLYGVFLDGSVRRNHRPFVHGARRTERCD